MRLNHLCRFPLLAWLLALCAALFAGCNIQTSSSEYEPIANEVYWLEDEIENLPTAPESHCLDLSDKMKQLALDTPLDSEVRITAYAWELARVMDGSASTRDTEWYVHTIMHTGSGVWVIHYIQRDLLNADVRGGTFVFWVRENDGTILNSYYTE